MTTETYLKDSQNLIQKIKDIVFDKEPYLYSLEIVSLYTNIRQEDATLKITEFMSRRLESTNLNIFGLFKLTCFVMFYFLEKGSSLSHENGLSAKKIKRLFNQDFFNHIKIYLTKNVIK